jgi:PII-like signaling protein
VNTLKRADLDEASLLRIYTLAGDRAEKQCLAEAVVAAAREAGLGGATVLRGIEGFGRHGYEPLLYLQEIGLQFQPLVVEIVDAPEKLEAFLPTLAGLNTQGRLVTLERIRIHSYHTEPAE